MKCLAQAVLVATISMASSATAASILDLISEDDRFTILVRAVRAGGLTEALSGRGPFTIYAPVDAAFGNLQDGLVSALFLPENKEQLTNIVLFHVDNRKLVAAKIPKGSTLFKPMLTEKRMCITKTADDISIADSTGDVAHVLGADIKASNGVIHVIDKVLVPGMRPACG